MMFEIGARVVCTDQFPTVGTVVGIVYEQRPPQYRRYLVVWDDIQASEILDIVAESRNETKYVVPTHWLPHRLRELDVVTRLAEVLDG